MTASFHSKIAGIAAAVVVVAVGHFQGAEDPELHHSGGSQWLLSPPAHVRTVRSHRVEEER